VPPIIRELHLSKRTPDWVNSIYSLDVRNAHADHHSAAPVACSATETSSSLADRVLVASVLAARAGQRRGGSSRPYRCMESAIGHVPALHTAVTVERYVQSAGRGRLAYRYPGVRTIGAWPRRPSLAVWLTTDFTPIWRWAFLITCPTSRNRESKKVATRRGGSDPRDDRAARYGGGSGPLAAYLKRQSGTPASAPLIFALIEGHRFGWYYATANQPSPHRT